MNEAGQIDGGLAQNLLVQIIRWCTNSIIAVRTIWYGMQLGLNLETVRVQYGLTNQAVCSKQLHRYTGLMHL